MNGSLDAPCIAFTQKNLVYHAHVSGSNDEVAFSRVVNGEGFDYNSDHAIRRCVESPLSQCQLQYDVTRASTVAYTRKREHLRLTYGFYFVELCSVCK
jgi:hypothetical protein